MGQVRVQIVVVNPRTGARSEEVTVLADTGATLTVVPGETVPTLVGLTVLEQLGLAVDPVQRRLLPTDFLLY